MARSKSHPLIDLKESIHLTTALEQRNGTRWVHLDAILPQIRELVSSNDAADAALSTLGQFGLMEERGKKNAGTKEYRLTDIARDIVRDERPDSNERMKNLRLAALSPPVYSTLYTPEKPIPDIYDMRDYCKRRNGFTETGTETFLQNYPTTIQFAGLSEARILEGEGGDKSADNDGDAAIAPPPPQPGPVSHRTNKMPGTYTIKMGDAQIDVGFPVNGLSLSDMDSEVLKSKFGKLIDSLQTIWSLAAEAEDADDAGSPDSGPEAGG